MNIDLSKVINSSPNSLNSRALLRSVIMDLYPNERKEMNILINIFESGIPDKIKKKGTISETQYFYYVKQIVEEYGIQEQYAAAGLKAWIETCISKEYVSNLELSKIANKNSIKVSSESIVEKSHKNVSGNEIDFEIRETVNPKAIEIIKFRGLEKEQIIVPNEIAGKKVIGIGDSAYQNCNLIKNIIVAEGIEYISNEAFSKCKNLNEVILPSTLRKMGEGVFKGDYLLEKVELSNAIEKIPKETFIFCKSLKNINFPEELVDIGSFAFAYTSLKNITLPKNTKKISTGAFYGCEKLSEVVLNEGLDEIQERAFAYTTNLKEIIIPKSVKMIEKAVFDQKKDFTAYCYFKSPAIECLKNGGFRVRLASPKNY